MSGEDFNFSQEQENREQNQNVGADVLAQMPEFSEHMKSFNEAKQNGEVPDGVRDEQDYKEFLAEQEARNNEFKKFDNEIFEGIMSIEDPDDKDLATAILPFYYNDSLNDNDASKQGRRVGIKAVVNYMYSDKSMSLEDTISKAANNLLNDAKHTNETRIVAREAFYPLLHSIDDNIPTDLADLRIGQEIESLNLSEAVFNENEQSYRFNYHDGNRERSSLFQISAHHIAPQLLGEPPADDSTKITLSVANSLAKQINETNDREKKLASLVKMEVLKEAHFLDPYKIEQFLDEKREKALSDVIESTKEVMNAENYNRLDSSLPIKNSGLIQLVCIDELINTFKNYKRADTMYKHSLKVGKDILSGKDFNKIDIHDDI